MMALGYDPELPVGRDAWLPAQGAALLHDARDGFFGKCHIYVVRAVRGLKSEGYIGNLAYVRAKGYWDENGPSLPGLFEVPIAGWKHVARVKHIRYFRPDEGWLEHPFAEPVSVLQTQSGPLAWQLSLPGSCLVNSRGFITP